MKGVEPGRRSTSRGASPGPTGGRHLARALSSAHSVFFCAFIYSAVFFLCRRIFFVGVAGKNGQFRGDPLAAVCESTQPPPPPGGQKCPPLPVGAPTNPRTAGVWGRVRWNMWYTSGGCPGFRCGAPCTPTGVVCFSGLLFKERSPPPIRGGDYLGGITWGLLFGGGVHQPCSNTSWLLG